MLDVVIVGGSSAGLSAALVLGRSLREVVVIDDQKPCNRYSRASHGYLTRDGTPPGELLRLGREQLNGYTTVSLKAATAIQIEKTSAGFDILSSDGSMLQTRCLLLATGLKDTLPEIDGIDALWGKSVFHCPYCDGYEVRGKRIVVYGTGDGALHLVMLLRNLTDKLTLIAAEGWEPSQDQRERAIRSGVRMVENAVSSVESDGTRMRAMRFADGMLLEADAMFIRPKTSHRTTFAYDLGCKVDESGVVQVDLRGRTSVDRVYAAGDLSSPIRSVAIAVAQGAAAGYGINADLARLDFE